MKHLVEIGCDGISSLENFLEDDIVLDIFEPNPTHISNIRQRYDQRVNVFPYALGSEKGTAKFHCCGVLSHLDGVHSPAVANYGYVAEQANIIDVEVRTFDEFDDGTIDFLDLDAEGCEWYVLEKMKSRPKFIVVEMLPYKNYQHAHYEQIVQWLADNQYRQFHEEPATGFYKKMNG